MLSPSTIGSLLIALACVMDAATLAVNPFAAYKSDAFGLLWVTMLYGLVAIAGWGLRRRASGTRTMLALPGAIFLASLVQPLYERFYLSQPYSLKEAFKPLPVVVTIGGEALLIILIALSFFSLPLSEERNPSRGPGFSGEDIRKIDHAFMAFSSASVFILLLIAWNWAHPAENVSLWPKRVADLFLYGAALSAAGGIAFTLLVLSKWSLVAVSTAGLMLAGVYGSIVRGLAEPADIGFMIIGIAVFFVAGTFYNAARWFLRKRPSEGNESLSSREKAAVVFITLLGWALLFWWFRPSPPAPPPVRGLIVIDLATYHPGTRITPVFTQKAFRITFWNRPSQQPRVALVPAVPVPPVRVPVRAPAPPVMKSLPSSSSLNGVPMTNIMRTYTYIFRGRLTCGDQPCTDAQGRVALESIHNPDLQELIHPTGDGTYEVRVELTELPNESVRWTLNFAGTGIQTKELQGQAILMDDPTVTIEYPAVN
ncbi:MAG: hypothetical protein WC859_05780 [Elusimicrobiota bacterium]